MTTTKKSIMSIDNIYLDYGLDYDSWEKLVRLSDKVEKAGLKLEHAFSMAKDKKAGMEFLFNSKDGNAFMLSLNSRDKCLYCKVHRNMDVAANRMWKDQINNWNAMANRIVNYH